MDSSTILVICLICLPLMQAGTTQTCEQIVTKWTLWTEPSPGLAATLKVPVTQEVTAWGVSFTFNKEFSNLDFFNGVTEDHAGHSFNVTNEDWSGNKHTGDLISFSMLGDYKQGNEEDLVITDIGLNGIILCTNQRK
eukprot:GFUD01038199.1.p1 GENE.GFUD01038199.1~~GFUD01038199.1.p1  ORF type:complete len:150 (+),score=48.14 GFUD01038199.1:42-452(+)